MTVRPDPEQQNVEGRRRTVALRVGRAGQLVRVASGYGVEVVAVRAVARTHRMHPLRIEGHAVEQRLAGLRLVALRVAGRQEPLVTPPNVEGAPVDGIAGRCGGELTQGCDADASSGQHHR